MKHILIFFLFTYTAFAETFYTARVDIFPGGSFKLEGKEIRGTITKSGETYTADKLKISIKKLDAGIDLRSKHLHKFLSDKTTHFIWITDAKASAGKGTAQMKIKGVTKQIEFKYSEAENNHILLAFKIELPNFSLEAPRYMSVGVEDTVKIEAKLPYTMTQADKVDKNEQPKKTEKIQDS